jgi:molybdopterin converting factor small subunit
MAILVRLPATLSMGPTVTIEERVANVGELVEVLERRLPDLAAVLDDSVFNFAVNDEMLLHRAREYALADGDTVEIVPAISGGG